MHWSVKPVPNRPGAQSEQVADPAADHLPDSHGAQDVEPDEAEVPAGQIAHTVERDVSEDVAPGSAYLPVGHETSPEQSLEISPVFEPYFPAGHLAQTVSSVTVFDLAPATAYVPIEHKTSPEHEEVVLPPVPNFPAGQLVHSLPAVE